MENLSEKVEAFDKATSTINKRPWAAIIVILVIYSYFLYKVGEWSSRDQIAYLKAENKEAKDQLEKAREDNKQLYTNLLERNNIIDRQGELINYADSTVTKIKEQQFRTKK